MADEHDDTHLYAQVAEELERGEMDKGLWTKILVHTPDGSESLQRRLYIKARVEQLANAARVEPEPEVEPEEGDHLPVAAADDERREIRVTIVYFLVVLIVFFAFGSVASAQNRHHQVSAIFGLFLILTVGACFLVIKD